VIPLAERFDRRLAALALPPGPALVAVSGGADSLALLDLLARSPAAGALALEVAHLDHGIAPESPRVMEAVRSVAARYGLPFHGHRLDLGPHATETQARRARYDWLERTAVARGATVIFTAHHRDDQIETVLMRMLRGSGPAGLAGMAARRGRIVRPLLRFSRAALTGHVQSLGLAVWEDPANRDTRQLRSWIRIELLPALRTRIPDIERNILRLARLAARERAGWDSLLAGERALDLRVECDGVSVAASPLGDYDSTAVQALLGALGRRAGCQVGPVRAARIERLLAGGRSGAVAQLGHGCAIELTFGRLRLFRDVAHHSGNGANESPGWNPVVLEGSAGARAIGPWRIRWSTEPAPQRIERMATTSWLAPGNYRVRPWRPGDRIRPLGGRGRRLVVRCMQDARLARHVRPAWPVLESGGTVVWVPGVVRSAEALPEPGGPALRIDADLG
jgi:tRNA(Ile)-lysidine synthase